MRLRLRRRLRIFFSVNSVYSVNNIIGDFVISKISMRTHLKTVTTIFLFYEISLSRIDDNIIDWEL